MLKKLAPSLKGYGIYAILTPVIIIGEVLMEVLIPRVMGKIIDNGIMKTGGVDYVVKMGGLMVVMATFSLSVERWQENSHLLQVWVLRKVSGEICLRKYSHFHLQTLTNFQLHLLSQE